MVKFIKPYIVALSVFILLDLTWLGVVARGIYRKHLSYLLRPSPFWPAAIAFYLLFIAGLVIFVIRPAVEKGSWAHALIYGALFGFVTYMTYELTNYALIRDWPLTIVFVDIAWGAFLLATVSVVTFFIINR